MKQNKDAVWPLVLRLVTGVRTDPGTRTHMISYVCAWGSLLLILHWNTHLIFLVGTSVPGSQYSRYDFFFFGFKTYGATHAGRILYDTNRKRENSRLWLFEVKVIVLLDRSRAWTILMGRRLWIACGDATVVSHSWLAFFVTNSQLTQANDVFVYTLDRSTSTWYVLCRSSRS